MLLYLSLTYLSILSLVFIKKHKNANLQTFIGKFVLSPILKINVLL